MSAWTSTVTNAGSELLGLLVAGETLNITRAVSGSTAVPIVDIKTQTQISDVAQTLTMQPAQTREDGSVIIPVVLDNTKLKSEYTLWQVGIFAQHPEKGEILFLIAQAENEEVIPTAKDAPGFSIEWRFYFKNSNDVNINVNVDPAGLVSLEVFNQHAGDKTNPHGVTAEQIGAATAADHQFKTYTSLKAFGLTTDSFGENSSDLENNIKLIVDALPDNGQIASHGTTHKLTLSLKARLIEDLGVSANSSVDVAFRITKFGSKTAPGMVEVMADSQLSHTLFVSRFDVTNGQLTLEPFIYGYRPEGFLPKNATASDVGAVPNTSYESNFKLFLEKMTSTGDERAISHYQIADGLEWRVDVQRNGVQYRLIKGTEVLVNYTIRDSSNYLPLTGGKLSGSLQVNDGYGVFYGNSTETYFGARRVAGDSTNVRYVAIDPREETSLANALYFVERNGSTNNIKKLLGEHNKPSGSYTGNGSATARTINVGGIGGVLFLQGANYNSLVTYYGALSWSPQSGTVQAVSDGSIYFRNGVLTIKSTSSIFNSNGSSYNYGSI